jgi:hypothetical protein
MKKISLREYGKRLDELNAEELGRLETREGCQVKFKCLTPEYNDPACQAYCLYKREPSNWYTLTTDLFGQYGAVGGTYFDIMIKVPEKVKKTYWVNVFTHGERMWTGRMHPTLDDAKRGDLMAAAKCVGTYPLEIEVEE